MKTVAIIQARLGSTRLPGKILKPILGKPMLVHQIDRVKRVKELDQIIVATTAGADAAPVLDVIRHMKGVFGFQGPEQDVLARFYEAAREFSADTIVRFTADCPLLSPEVSSRIIQYFLDHQDAVDYVSNCQERTFPRGFDTEVFSRWALGQAFRDAKTKSDREHVTPFIRNHPERFRLHNVVDLNDNSHLRLTVDTKEDFELVRTVYERLYPGNQEFEYRDILQLFEQDPNLRRINQNVEQKTV